MNETDIDLDELARRYLDLWQENLRAWAGRKIPEPATPAKQDDDG